MFEGLPFSTYAPRGEGVKIECKTAYVLNGRILSCMFSRTLYTGGSKSAQ